ncbi:ATP-binding protein [Chlorogloeopsis sp. ULAP01]|uniref:ATP-binding protein n=1 Tax=Chlorogloeopsis sp. ULAP01 TaxID=3056483 RepID=UPI0025AB19F2|nr:ATP-binding protein [Chlorogloeopsis sp. ULAP01]MDM9379587.1 ATP-binding protein [Chlorogloeopsis sp. ULAP01]
MGQQCLNLWIALLSQDAADRVTRTLLVEREAERLLNAVIDEQRASQGAYQKEEIAVCSSLNRLYWLLQNNSTQIKQLDRIKNIYSRWQSQLAQGTLSDSASTNSLTEKNLFDSLRAQIRILLMHEELLMGERKHRLQQLYYINIAVNVFCTVVIVAGITLNIRLLHQRVEVPLRKLIKVGEVWRKGQMDIRFDYSSPDEIGQLTEVLNEMVAQARERQQRIEVRNQQLEDMISALSHDLRTPLLATRATLDGMLKGAFGSVSCVWKEVFQEFRQANEDLLKLVEALLDVSRYEAGYGARLNYEPLNWERIFVKAIAQIQATSKCEPTLVYNISQSLPIVYGDELEIRRVVQNLLDNAVRVSEPDKEIFLQVASFGNTQVRISVRDYGSGIAPQDKERLFHRFIQGRGRRGKSGLGLYLCRQIVEAHGGRIGVESTLKEGSTFWFTLPIAKIQAASKYEKQIREE